MSGIRMCAFSQAGRRSDVRGIPSLLQKRIQLLPAFLAAFLAFFHSFLLFCVFSHDAYSGSWILITKLCICDVSLTSKHCGIECPHFSHKEFLFLMSYDCDAKYWDNAFWL